VTVFCFISFLSTPAYSQLSQLDAEKATRETDRLDKEKKGEELRKIPESAEIKHKEALIKKEGQRFFIKKINLVGCESFPPEDFFPFIKKYENQEVTLSDLETLAKEIEGEYLMRGIIAIVFIPEQDIEKETVILRVVEGRMGELQTQKHKYFKNQRLSYYWKIKGGEVLRYDKISRYVQMMNENPDRKVKAVLRAGKKPGTSDITLTAKTNFPIHLSSTFDKEGSTATGKSRIGAGIQHNNFLGLDDILLTGYTFGKDFSGTYVYHNIPISPVGTSFLYGYSRSESTPKKEYAAYVIKSEAKNTALSIHQDLYRKDVYLGEVSIGFDAKDKTTITKDGVLNRDKLRIFSLGANFFRRGLKGTTSFYPQFSQGVQAFGSSHNDNPLASRGAKSSFSKFNLGIRHKRILPLNLQANLKAETQLSSRKLTPQEEFSLGGIDSVRGYPSGDYLADNAFISNAELLIPSVFIPQNWRLPYAKESLRNEVASLLFVDYGWGKRRGALPTEKKAVDLLGIGAGLRISFFDQAFLRLEWGFPLAGNRPVTEGGHSRFHFSIDFREKLPEEIERIRKIVEEENIKQRAWHLVNEELARPASPLTKKMHRYIYLAESYYRQGELEKSRQCYEKVIQVGRSLYMQAEEYVRGCLALQKELRDRHALAVVNYQQGNLAKAKELWQEIIDEAKPQQLIFEF